MEKKKILVLTATVGGILVIVIAAAMMYLAWGRPASPSGIAARPGAAAPAAAPVPFGQAADPAAAAQPDGSAAKPAGPASVDAVEWARNPSAVAGIKDAPPPSASAQGGSINIYFGEQPAPPAPAPARTASDGSTVIDIPLPSAPKAPTEIVPAPAADKAPAAVPAAVRAEPAKKAPEAPAAKPAAKPAPKAAPAAKPASDTYWVQTGAFAAKARAEAAKATLARKGISSLVETKDVDGKTLFRVRVGPYASKAEAEYWLSLVKTVEGFGESYVSLLKAKR